MKRPDSIADRREQYGRILGNSPEMYRTVHMLPCPRDAVELAATHVWAPALGAFTEWVLQKALGAGVRRLYFLARDGYFPFQAARILCERRHLPLECRYLSCSRYSVRLPLFHLNREAALAYVCRSGIAVTPDRILRRAGLTQEEREAVWQRLQLPISPDAVLPYAGLPEIRRRLRGCQLFCDYMDRHSRAALPGLAGYMRQEGLLDDVQDALVDSGWVGSMQQTLGQLLRRLGRVRPLSGYYWGLYELPAGAPRRAYHGYAFGPEGPLHRKVYFNNNLFEAVFSAPHGMTVSYRQEGERYVPVYEEIGQGRREWNERLEGLLLPYIRRLAERQGALRAEEALSRDRETVCRLLRVLMCTPTDAEAAAFGVLPFSDDVLERGDRPIAAPLSRRELRAHHPLPKLLSLALSRDGGARESAWFEGSAVLQGGAVRRHLRQYTLYKYLLHARKQLRYRRIREGEFRNG